MDEDVSGIANINDLHARSSVIDYSNYPEAFVREAFLLARPEQTNRGLTLAALFDLAVTALYLERVPTSGWYYCNEADSHHPQLVYPFVNACPSCVLSGYFRHLKSGKPESAAIGKATSTILAAFLDLQAQAGTVKDFHVRTLSDNGLVDAFLVGPKLVGLFEIKAAPLIAFPLTMVSAALTSLDDEQGELIPTATHSTATVPPGSNAYLMIDETLRIPVGDPHSFVTKNHYRAILAWIKTGDNLAQFIQSWSKTFAGYAHAPSRGRTYWLTNGCGSPHPRPTDWPRRPGSGYESISDGKSSVGLDRTDDVKKGIYQVLKISTHYKEFFPSGQYEVFVALVSNIHAVKHHNDYLHELEDLVWTLDGPTRSYVQSRDEDTTLIQSKRLYNLFDALISFTRSHFRSSVLEEIYDFNR